MTSPRPKVPWSHWDRFLFIILGLVVVFAVSLSLWFHALDKNPDVSVPNPVMPANNAFEYYKAATEALMDSRKVDWAISRLPPGQKPSGDQRNYSLAEKEALVRENAGAVQILHMGFRYPYQEPPKRSFSATFPEYAELRQLARFLSLQAQVAAEKGDWNGAMSADLDAVQLGETLPRGGPLIGMLVGVACQSIGRRHAWGAIDHLSAAQAKAQARRLEGIRASHVPFADTMQEEEWETQASLLEAMKKRDWPGNLLTVASPYEQGNGPTWSDRVTATRIRLMGKRAVMASYTHGMNRTIANARQPYALHLSDPAVPNDPMSQILFPVFSQVRLREAGANTQNALLLTQLALRAYRLDHGIYPATVSALAPAYLQVVPNDPFALSSQLRYKNLGGSYLLYSVGPDGKDDGGKPIFDKSKSPPSVTATSDQRYYIQADSSGDIVAGVNIN